MLVGMFEASIFPACMHLISSCYVGYDAHKMLAILYSIGLLASSFAGVLAYALALLQGHSGWLVAMNIYGTWLNISQMDMRH